MRIYLTKSVHFPYIAVLEIIDDYGNEHSVDMRPEKGDLDLLLVVVRTYKEENAQE